MEHITLLIYLASIVEGLSFLLTVVGVIGLVFWVIVALGLAFEDESFTDSVKPYHRIAKYVGVIGLIGAALIPSKDAMYLMVGAEIGKEVVQSETAKKVKAVLDKKLDEILAEGVKK